MAKINRITGNVDAFAKDALGTERTVFGGVTQSDDLNDQINADFKRGWGIVGSSEFPKIQDFNAVGFTTSMLSAYLYQMGIAEWHGAQQYQIRSVANTPDGIYICKTANHTNVTSPKDDPSNWDALVSQSFGTSTTVTVNQKVITDEINARLPRADVLGFTGTSTTAVMNQKIVTDELALRLAQSNIKQATGSSTTDVMSQKSVSDQLIGVGKTWSNVTANRAWNTEYTNTKGRTLPIAVIVKDPSAGNLSAKLFIDSELHSEVYTSTGFTQTLCADIPAGSTYELKRTDNNDVIISWKEL